jgi:hypothetical protein
MVSHRLELKCTIDMPHSYSNNLTMHHMKCYCSEMSVVLWRRIPLLALALLLKKLAKLAYLLTHIRCGALFIQMVYAGGGIGGGGVLVPLYILCLGFQTENAVALSNLTIAGGAFANFAINVFRFVSFRFLPSICVCDVKLYILILSRDQVILKTSPGRSTLDVS